MTRFLHQVDAGRAFLGGVLALLLVGFSVFVLTPVARAEDDPTPTVTESTDDPANTCRDAGPDDADDCPTTGGDAAAGGDDAADGDAGGDPDPGSAADVPSDEPSPSPSPSPTPEPVPPVDEPDPEVEAAADDQVVVLSDDQFAKVEAGLALVVALLGTHVVASWGRR